MGIKMSLGDLFDKIRDAFVDYFGEKVEEFNKSVGVVREDIKIVSDKFGGVHQNINRTFDKVEDISKELDAKINGVNQGIGSTFTKTQEIQLKVGENLDGKISDISDELANGFSGVEDIINDKFDDTDEKLSTLNDNVTEILRIYMEEVGQLKEKAEQAVILNQKLTDSEQLASERLNQISSLNIELTTANDKVSSLEQSLIKTENELKSVQDELKSEIKNSSQAEESLRAWKAAVGIYAPVRTAMKNCDTFTKFLEERGLNDDSELGLFVFVQELGKTIDFVRDIHQTALDARKQQGSNPKLMTAEEIAVYDALNKCYKSIWNIDFDIFLTPGNRKSIAESFKSIPFSRDEAIVFKDPRNKSLKFTKGIYVPMLLNREGKMYKQAYVDAGNLS